jgi:hypothetical protein
MCALRERLRNASVVSSCLYVLRRCDKQKMHAEMAMGRAGPATRCTHALERHAIHDLLAAGAGTETKDRVLGMHAWLSEAHEGDVAQEFRRLLPC